MANMTSNTLKTLSLDSATPVGSVALLAGPRLLAQDRFQGPEGHVVLLPECVDRLLTETSWACMDLDLIAVTIGPGSFSGVRIALGYAKGIALAQETPVVGISNLDLLAAGTGRQEGWVSVAMDARRGEIFAALYQLKDGMPADYEKPGVAQSPETWATTLAAMPALQDTSVCMTGSGVGPYAPLFHKALGTRFEPTPESAWTTDPFILGTLGQNIFLQQGGTTPATLLEPLRIQASTSPDYQRRPEAEEKKYGRSSCTSDP